jgi:hypothetical protein
MNEKDLIAIQKVLGLLMIIISLIILVLHEGVGFIFLIIGIYLILSHEVIITY